MKNDQPQDEVPQSEAPQSEAPQSEASQSEAPQSSEQGRGPQEEWVPQDDAVIGRAFGVSLRIFLALAVVIAALLIWWRWPKAQEAEVELNSEAPVDVRQEQAERSTPPPVLWRDVTTEVGIDFVHYNGAQGEKLLPETMGGGAAFFDYDGDGDADLLLTNGTSWPHDPKPAQQPTSALYRNDDGRFTDVTGSVLPATAFYGTGVAVGDYDGDGRVDLFLTAVGTNHLYRNTETGFVEVEGVGGSADEWSTSAAFFDLEGDGDLDLFVGNYVRWSRQIDAEVDYRLTGVGRAYGPPVNYQGSFSYLYRNEGGGKFTDISADSGIQVRNEATDVPVGKALGVAPVDIDGDGLIDLLVANDTVQNFLFHNRGDGTFEEMAELYGLAYGRNGEATGAMGIDAGHYRNDGDLGFAIGNFANEMTSLYISQGEATLFADEAIGEGVGAPSRSYLTFGMLFFDYDLDGRLDMLSNNGHLENEIQTVDASQTYEQPAQLMWNAGSQQRQTFIAVPPEATGDLATPLVGRGSAVADIDNDGDLDVVLTQTGRRPLLLRNEQATGHHWLRVALRDPSGGPTIGAWLDLQSGGETQRRQMMPSRSYQSQSELVVTFGLGTADSVETLTVTWPDGMQQAVAAPAAVDRLIVVEKE